MRPDRKRNEGAQFKKEKEGKKTALRQRATDKAGRSGFRSRRRTGSGKPANEREEMDVRERGRDGGGVHSP